MVRRLLDAYFINVLLVKKRKKYWLSWYFKQRFLSILSENIRDFLTFLGGREGGHWPEIGEQHKKFKKLHWFLLTL